ncbi:MAG: T9SS type A sorting domain-containing protein [Bacteroidota bacterium]
MKKTISIYLLFTSVIFIAKAQPNPGFEDWVNEYSYEVPQGWQTLNFMSLLTPPNPISAFKAVALDKHSGNYALKLETVYFNNIPPQVQIADSTGGAYTGKITYSPPSNLQGFPYTSRPEKFEFWAKYSPVGNDTGRVSVILQKRNGTSIDTIAFCLMNIPATSDYTLFQLTIPYLSNAIPDTAAIGFGSSKNTETCRLGSTLFVDDMSFSGWVGIDEQNRDLTKVDVFPNPARDRLNIKIHSTEAERVRVIDSSGRVVGLYKIVNNEVSINTTILSTGLSFYHITDKKGDVLAKGKFEVIR